MTRGVGPVERVPRSICSPGQALGHPGLATRFREFRLRPLNRGFRAFDLGEIVAVLEPGDDLALPDPASFLHAQLDSRPWIFADTTALRRATM